MGVWGYFSHENDLVSDEWLRFTELYIKKYHSHIMISFLLIIKWLLFTQKEQKIKGTYK